MKANLSAANVPHDLPAPVPFVAVGGPAACAPTWSYEEAFARNRGLISAAEQAMLRRSRIAIAGLGGVGGVHLVTLTRLGVGAFQIADPDCFELVNLNRQYGATLRALGRAKVEVMAEEARAVNPDVAITPFPEGITPHNVSAFLDGADLLIDGLDFFNIETRRLVFREARRRGIWALTAGPIGFGTAWLTFSPRGMTFDKYFDLRDGMDRLDQVIAFAVGLTPRATHLNYLDLNQVDPAAGTGPSVALACHLCSGTAACEAMKIILGRGPLRPAPWYFQFDAYRGVLRKGYLPWGNRHPWQRFKRWWLRRKFQGTLPPESGFPSAPETCSASEDRLGIH